MCIRFSVPISLSTCLELIIESDECTSQFCVYLFHNYAKIHCSITTMMKLLEVTFDPIKRSAFTFTIYDAKLEPEQTKY